MWAGATFFSWSDKLTFPASRFRLEAVTLLCSNTFSSNPPDRLRWVWLTLPLMHHIVLKFMKIKFEGGFNSQNTVVKGQSETTWKYPSLCRKLYIIIAYYCQSVPATMCYSVPGFLGVRRQGCFLLKRWFWNIQDPKSLQATSTAGFWSYFTFRPLSQCSTLWTIIFKQVSAIPMDLSLGNVPRIPWHQN